MRNLSIPSHLKKGDAIGVVSPSAGLAPFAMHRVELAQAFLEKAGYKVKFAKHALKNNGYVSASVQDRVEDIHQLFLDESVKMIICTIGGNHSNQLLQHLDFDLIKKNPKIFMGYSDITVLHHAIQKKANLMTFYGPMLLTQLGESPKPLPYSVKSMFDTLTSLDDNSPITINPASKWTDEVLDWFEKKDLDRPRKMEKNTTYHWLKKGRGVGFSWGGAIISLNHLAGTEFWIDPDGAVAFLDIPEGKSIHEGLSIAEIASYLADYENIGVFKKINGLIIGRPYQYQDKDEEDLKNLLLEQTQDYNFPILYGADIGHTDPIFTMPNGAIVTLDSDKNVFSLSYSKSV